ncbi:hypothetical protein K7X08_035444 [Anisodus acutangulus]|uniref:Uncharacterized protein n=1 Tax=Anisodus acutangulus TaxID=402998 RepID=A0A9Q1LHE8_9SOLA|nr:hypothetical protein K7X08_035444 [Anisodus acutangulus]
MKRLFSTVNGGEDLDQINLEEPELTGKRDINESGNKIKKASSITTEKEKNKVSTGLKIAASMEKIAEAVALRAAMSEGSKKLLHSILFVTCLMSLSKNNNDEVGEVLIGDDDYDADDVFEMWLIWQLTVYLL